MLIVSILLFQIIETPEIITPSDVRVGMEGFGLSVFMGSKIDTFQVKITGKLPPTATGREIILAELKGDVINEAGVLAGMSGSPVYINGKLLGAVAYSWAFSKKPICGITPFVDMKKGGVSPPLGSYGLTPISPVLNVSGFSPKSYSLLDSLPGNFVISFGQSGGLTLERTPFVPGGVCGVSLITGDGTLSMMGTITEVKGDTIYAFGHPAYGTGISNLPLCEGGVSGYLPSYYHSFKFANPGQVVGTILFDGDSGVKGILKRKPPMVDCKIVVNKRKREYKITEMKNLFPLLMAFLLYSNWVEEMGVYNPVTINGRFDIYTSQGKISLYPVISGDQLQTDIYRWTRGVLLDIQGNRYEGVAIDSMKVNIDVKNVIRKYFVERLQLKKKEFELGEEMTLSVIIDQYRKPDTTVTCGFRVPDEPCELVIMVSGRDEFLSYERERVPLNFEFDDFSEWKNYINDLPSRDQVIFSLYKKGRMVGTKRGELRDIPFSLQSILNGNGNLEARNLFPIYEKQITLKGPVTGVAKETIEVRR